MKQATAIKGEDLTLFASPWSAPAWMKTNNDFIVLSIVHVQFLCRFQYIGGQLQDFMPHRAYNA